MEVKIWHVVYPLGLILFLVMVAGTCSECLRPKTTEYQPIKEPLAVYDSSATVITGTVFKIDSSNIDLLAAGMEMIELKLDEGKIENNLMIRFAASPAPVGTFKIGDKATWKSIYLRSSEVSGLEFFRILIKR